MTDEERRNLLRDYQAGDTSALEKIQNLNSRLGLSSDDATYLQEYLALCERFLNTQMDQDNASRELIELNKKWEALVGSKTLRNSLIGSHLATYDGWVPSEICW